jgi:hypothetical protein
MANNFGRVNVSVTASTGGLTAGLSRAGKALRGFASGVSSVTSPFSALGAIAKSTFGQLVMFSAAKGAINSVTGAIGSAAEALSSAVESATSLGEETSKSGVIFGASASKVAAFAKQASGIGLAQSAALSATGTFGNLFTAMGLGADKSADYATTLTALGADLASFNNTSVDDAIGALGAALRGESEPIRRFGVLLDDATLKQQALSMGLVKTTKGTLSPAIKAQAAYGVILKQTSAAQGDFARTSGSLANLSRVISAKTTNVVTTIGKAFEPLYTSIAAGVSRILSAVQPVFEKIGEGLRSSVKFLQLAIESAVPKIEKFISGIDGTSLGERIGRGIIDGAKYLAQVAELVVNKFREMFFMVSDALGKPISKEAAKLKAMNDQLMRDEVPLVAVAPGIAGRDPKFFKELSRLDQIVFEQRKPLTMFSDIIAQAEKSLSAMGDLNPAVQEPPKPTPPPPISKPIAPIVRISSADLNAIVSGTSGAESFRNALARGADPRLETKEDTRRTADASERTAEATEELLARTMTLGVAAIA